MTAEFMEEIVLEFGNRYLDYYEYDAEVVSKF